MSEGIWFNHHRLAWGARFVTWAADGSKPTRQGVFFCDYRASVRPVEGTGRDGAVSGSHRVVVGHAFTAPAITCLQVRGRCPIDRAIDGGIGSSGSIQPV